MADAICCNCIYFKGKAGGFGDCILRNRTVHWQEIYCNCFRLKESFNKDAKDGLKLQVVRVANIRDAKELPCGTLVQKGSSVYLVGNSNELIPVHTEEDNENEIKKQAYKEFAEKIKQEIKEAYDSNIEVLNEHFEKHRGCFNDTFVGIIEGKNNALLGLFDFIDNLLKEMVGRK